MMTTAQWFLLIGILILAIGLTSNKIKTLPVTPSIIYLLVGLILGPTVFGLFDFKPFEKSAFLELLTEIAVLISLFSVGVKMPYPFKLSQWRTPILLATVSMAITVGLMAFVAYFLFDLPVGACILLGAIIAPTDPVLATEVQTREPGDRDQLRFNLTCEAGMNDGTAFPFVMLGLGLLGLHEMGNQGFNWLAIDLFWATFGAVAIGIVSGLLLARLTWLIRGNSVENTLKNEFLSLGLIGVVYGLALIAHTYGFLAVFFAAAALHQSELKLMHDEKKKELDHQILTKKQETEILEEGNTSTVSESALIFKEYLEGISEVIIVLLVGGMMALSYWKLNTVAFAVILFFIVRPFSVILVLLGSKSSWRVRNLTGWFGIRGIGSLYYLMYALQHGVSKAVAIELLQITLVVITLSILLHGTSVKPLLRLFWKRRRVLK